MTQYADIFMRDFVGDTGQIPSTTRTTVSQSPDIIPAGTTPVANYQTYYANNYYGPINSYNYYHNLQQQNYNYIYLRADNLYPGAQTGQVYLYYCPSSLLLLPDQWINNRIPCSNAHNYANFTATTTNQIVVGDAPFYWLPPPLSSSQGHYCLIAQVVTSEDPNPIPSGDDLHDFALWVADHPGIAWRNVTVINTVPPPGYSGYQTIANPHANHEIYVLLVTCLEIPDGTVVSLVCPVEGPAPAINLVETVGPANQMTSDPKSNLFSTTSRLPGNFVAQVQLTAQTPAGAQLPFGASITVSCLLAASSSSKAAHVGFRPEEIGLDASVLGDEAESGVLLLLGDYTYRYAID
ncbi:hypothetical protein [Sphingomonas sp. KR3-1]|uniref:hypothetical protein n=1 Tax=Sphingomonas sp. KR3-1 TaxID=3156611 RepID=UPI0032B4E369